MQPCSKQTNKAQCTKSITIFKLRLVLNVTIKPIHAQFFLNHIAELLKKLDISVIAEEYRTCLLYTSDAADE